MRILVIEDDPEVGEFVAKGLLEAGHVPEVVRDGRDGLVLATTEDFDAIVLDRMLPGLDGVSILKGMRSMGRMTPVLVLSALSDVNDRVDGLRAGGDDYLTKPFAFSELIARLEALARRGQAQAPPTEIVLGDLEVDLLARQVKRAGRSIELQPREYQLLEFLIRHQGQVVTRTMLLEHVWGYHFDPQTNVIDVHISRLRSKIDRGFDAPLLHTVRGIGYTMKEPG